MTPQASTDSGPDVLLIALADSTTPLTVPGLAKQLNLHTNTVRARLAVLIAGGLVERERVPTALRGRPAHVYQPSVGGWAEVRQSRSAQEYHGLSAAFAEHLHTHAADPVREARVVGRTWGRHLAAQASPGLAAQGPQAGTDQEPVAAQQSVVDLLEELRFSPMVDGDGIALRTCPLLDLAHRMPDVVCQVHRGLVEGTLEHRDGAAVTVDLVPFAEPGACRLRLT